MDNITVSVIIPDFIKGEYIRSYHKLSQCTKMIRKHCFLIQSAQGDFLELHVKDARKYCMYQEMKMRLQRKIAKFGNSVKIVDYIKPKPVFGFTKGENHNG